MSSGAEEGRPRHAGAALPLVLAAVVILTLTVVLVHRAALDVLRQGRTALAVARAREAAGAGLVTARLGGPLAGAVAGGAGWVVTVELVPTGDRVLRSTGTAQAPFAASADIVAVLDSTGRPVHRWMTMRR